jgi:SRSO17 transposase
MAGNWPKKQEKARRMRCSICSHRAVWDAEHLREVLREYVKERMGEVGGMFVIDETGFLKKGSKSVGVQRQYSGTAGRIENCQIGVYLTYTTAAGHTLLDRELYLPKRWTNDPKRCREADVPTSVGFTTKPELAARMRLPRPGWRHEGNLGLGR